MRIKVDDIVFLVLLVVKDGDDKIQIFPSKGGLIEYLNELDNEELYSTEIFEIDITTKEFRPKRTVFLNERKTK